MSIRVVQVPSANADFELVERETPEPGRGEVRVKVQACGVCHSDMFTKTGGYPGVEFPRVPGHEVAGVVDALGEGTEDWGYSVGDRVGVGWFGGHCHHCEPCRRGDFISCENGQISGITYDGGYADAMVAPVGGAGAHPRGPRRGGRRAAAVRRHHHLQRAAPLRRARRRRRRDPRCRRPRPPRRAVRAQPRLPHGRHRARHREGEARPRPRRPRLHRLDAQDVGAELQKLGGARVVLATVTNAEAMAATVAGSSRAASS